jgi:hypothetical protein
VDGCSEDYGEYVLEMGDYLDAMAIYQEEKVENFCAYCEQCADNQNQWNNGNDDAAQNGDERRLEEAAEEGDDAAAAEGDDAAAAEEDAVAEEDCTSICSNYNSICNQNNNNGDDAAQAETYFECVQVQNDNNGNAYYVGPHCDSDGFSIMIGVYSDEDCSTYIGHEVSLYDATGIDLSGIDMSVYYPHDCQSCKENVSYLLVIVLLHDRSRENSHAMLVAAADL